LKLEIVHGTQDASAASRRVAEDRHFVKFRLNTRRRSAQARKKDCEMLCKVTRKRTDLSGGRNNSQPGCITDKQQDLRMMKKQDIRVPVSKSSGRVRNKRFDRKASAF
jgi:hypothetical protein